MEGNLIAIERSRDAHSIRALLRLAAIALFLTSGIAPAVRADEIVDCDLLVVGGAEGGVAAAVQAARLGVKSIVLVNDIDWLGGQFTAEGLCAIDEWTVYKGEKAAFPRSGLFLEIMDRIEAWMRERYGVARPGNSFCAWTTCEPRDTERLFRELVAPYLAERGGPLRIYEHFEPASVNVTDGAVRSVAFESTRGGQPLQVSARLTIDASDWGDVVRLSGAAYLRGPDLKDRFQEPSAPTDAAEVQPNEMNPLTYCLVLRECEMPEITPAPPHYDERTYFGTTTATRDEYRALGWPKGTMGPFAPAWRDSVMAKGPYNEPPTVYTHRRLVDRHHNKLAPGSEAVLVNWPLQDYPTYDFPAHVAAELDAAEPGASRKNFVDMTQAQRRIVFADVKRHALGMLHHLQTTVHDKEPKQPISFRHLKLTDEFGTPDKLPPKPYVREALRLAALYVLREQDLRDADGVQSWARHMAADNVMGFQFNIDFHPTRRIFLTSDRGGPWAHIHSSLRNWSTHTDRCGLPLRSLVPETLDGLVTAGKSLGVTSIVSAAVRLHGHGMLSGQAAGTLAALCLDRKLAPRQVARDMKLVRIVQSQLISPPLDPFTKKTPPGVLLWPYQDTPPSADYFVAANQLAIRAILPGEPGLQDFEPQKVVRRRDAARAVARAMLSCGVKDAYIPTASTPTLTDVALSDADTRPIESLAAWGLIDRAEKFQPDEPATSAWLAAIFAKLKWKFAATEAAELTRARLAIAFWNAIADRPEKTFESSGSYLAAGSDLDGDGRSDLDDPLPFDRDNDSVPDRLDADP